MGELAWIALFTGAAGLLSAGTASLVLLMPGRHLDRLIPHFVSFATGALLGAAFLALIPHAMTDQGVDGLHSISATLALGILLFFVLEKAVLWRHCHHGEYCETHGLDVREAGKASGVLILVGDGIHNLVDGIVIGAAFLADPHLGVVTAVAVMAHEIPQELGDFGILLDAGFDRLSAFLWNLVSASAVLLGGLLAYLALGQAQALLPYVLALAAASFIYIAVADLMPGLHRKVTAGASTVQVVLIVVGVGVVAGGHALVH